MASGDGVQNENGAGVHPEQAGAETAQFQVRAQYIKDLSFESPGAPATLTGPGEDPNLQVNFNINAEGKGDNTYEAELKLTAKATNKAGVIYHLELVYAGLFHLKGVPEKLLHPVLLVNCPTLLFPFVRRLVADLTREGGFPTLSLDPIDFAALYQHNLKNFKEQQAKADS